MKSISGMRLCLCHVLRQISSLLFPPLYLQVAGLYSAAALGSDYLSFHLTRPGQADQVACNCVSTPSCVKFVQRQLIETVWLFVW